MKRVSKPICALLAVATLVSSSQAFADASTVGTGVGAVIGGILGSTIGGGSGQTAATIGGAAVGAIVGNNVGKNMDEQERIEQMQREEDRRSRRSSRVYSEDDVFEDTDYDRTYSTTERQGNCETVVSETRGYGSRSTSRRTVCRSGGTSRASVPRRYSRQRPIRTIPQNGMQCARGEDNRWLIFRGPSVIGSSQGFNSLEDCQASVSNSTPSLVCAPDRNGVQPIRIATNSPVGRGTMGFDQVNDCLAAVQNAEAGLICNVDSRTGEFTSYDISTNSATYRFGDDLDGCVDYTMSAPRGYRQ